MNVIWSPQAEDSWQQIADYIFQEFGVEALLDFSNKTDDWMDTLAVTPTVASTEESLKHLKKHHYLSVAMGYLTKIVLYVEDGTIYIADIWDTRRSPLKLATQVK